MANVEYDIPMKLLSPFLPAGLLLNQQLPLLPGSNNSPYYMVKADGYQIVPGGSYRQVVDPISQADGSSLEPPFVDGMVATMRVGYYVDERGVPGDRPPACGADLRVMDETLMGVLNSLRVWSADPNNQQRYVWTPTGASEDRMLTGVLLASWPSPTITEGRGEVSRVFSLGCQVPYAIGSVETDTAISDGSTATVTNIGNTSFNPVIEIIGPASFVTITNTTTGVMVVYDDSRPGAATIPGGDYGELVTFNGEIFLNSDGSNLIAALNPFQTGQFQIAPGANTITTVGADILIKWNNSYV